MHILPGVGDKRLHHPSGAMYGNNPHRPTASWNLKRGHSPPWHASASTIRYSQYCNVKLRSLAPALGSLHLGGRGRAVDQETGHLHLAHVVEGRQPAQQRTTDQQARHQGCRHSTVRHPRGSHQRRPCIRCIPCKHCSKCICWKCGTTGSGCASVPCAHGYNVKRHLQL